jgi:hypothetical protein
VAQLGALGLDLERLKADIASPDIDRILEQEVRDTRTLQSPRHPNTSSTADRCPASASTSSSPS